MCPVCFVVGSGEGLVWFSSGCAEGPVSDTGLSTPDRRHDFAFGILESQPHARLLRFWSPWYVTVLNNELLDVF